MEHPIKWEKTEWCEAGYTMILCRANPSSQGHAAWLLTFRPRIPPPRREVPGGGSSGRLSLPLHFHISFYSFKTGVAYAPSIVSTVPENRLPIELS